MVNSSSLFHSILEAEPVPKNARVDLFLLPFFKEKLPTLSRARFQSLIVQGYLSFNDIPLKEGSASPTAGTYTLVIPESIPSTIRPKEIALDILYEDEDILIINKAAGLTVHPGAGNTEDTVVNALLFSHKDKLSGIGGVERPGIVHRLDKETSGLMVIAKNDVAHQALSAQFSDRTLSRTYVALVFGILKESSGTIKTYIGRHPHHRQKMAVLKSEHRGKLAITHYKVLKTFAPYPHPSHAISLVECTLETGRTHQIRVHMQHLGHPIVGDPVYGKNQIPTPLKPLIAELHRQALHARTLKLKHPRTGTLLTFEAPLPEDIEALIVRLKSVF